ncbi:hypothetical protein BD770DRAFT_398689 [Pilaira anomala]|nr:hypothetical protein BD770DRAFT_398689 [Pilaira anomala]
MNTQVPPQLPPGWIALWDETSQRYYYMEQASGTTQWEIPTEASRGMTQGAGGEAESYGSGFPQPGGFAQPQSNTSYPQQNNSSYPQQPIGYPQQGGNSSPGFPEQPGFPSQQQSYSSGYPEKSYPDSPQQAAYPPNNVVATSYPTQQDYNSNESTTGQPGMAGQDGLDGPVGPNGERGIGKVFKGFSGGAITGTLIGFAAGKLLGNNNQHGGVSKYRAYT